MTDNIIKIAVRMTNNREMFDRIVENVHRELNSTGKVDMIFCSSNDEFASAGGDVEVSACYNLTPEIFSSLGGLKWIHFGATGVDGILFPEFVESDVILTKAVGFHSKVTAEHAFAMMLYFERKFAESIKFMETRKWSQREIAGQNGTLSGKTLGILGYGSVGKALAEMAKTFGMRVVVTSRSAADGTELSGVDKVYPLKKIEELISESDYFAICAPLTSETQRFIDADKLSHMKKSAVLINAARGAIVDEIALIEALTQKKIAGAGLDVFETEPLPEESPFFGLDNVFLSPHVAGNFAGYTELAASDFGKNLRRYIEGDSLMNIIDKSLGY